MTMEIEIGKDISPFFDFEFMDQLLEIVDGWVELLVGVDVGSVEVSTGYTGPIIPKNHPIWIQHRNNLEDHPLPKRHRNLR